MLIQKILKFLDWEDYYFIVPKGSEYNTTGKTELHNIDSIEPLLVGDLTILKALLNDWISAKFYY